MIRLHNNNNNNAENEKNRDKTRKMFAWKKK